uniref:MFS transporter n=1 Tax=uncultured Nocardioides sp. TaxID=198441 RepID=UPI0032B210EC
PPVVEQRGAPATSGRRDHLDWLGVLLLLVAMAAGGLVFQPPTQLLTDLTWGQLFIPFVEDGGRWLTPIGAVAIAAVVLLLLRTLTARRPLVDLRAWGRSLREADLVGATYLAVALGGVILAFATADPKIEVFSDQGWWYLLGAAIGTVAFVVHLRRAEAPLLPRGTLAARPAWGSVVVSFFVGTALIAALIDVPLFARTTVYPESQLMAALVLLRFLAALPVGAVVGGYLTRMLPAGLVAAAGMLMASGGFLAMSRWDITSLESWTATVPLVVGGLGFGLALAPVNAAILASTADAVHGVASAMVVVARMVGMLVGISALTTIGLRRYYAEQAGVPPVQDVCPAGTTRCSEYSDLLKAAGIAQEQTVFLGAAGCALVAAVLALVLLRGAATRGTPTRTGLGIG